MFFAVCGLLLVALLQIKAGMSWTKYFPEKSSKRKKNEINHEKLNFLALNLSASGCYVLERFRYRLTQI